MKTLYKYPLEVTDEQTIELPKGAEILCVQVQKEAPCIWAKVDPTPSIIEQVAIKTYGTGELFPDGEEYIGTYQLYEGDLVYHVFKIIDYEYKNH